MKRGRKIISPIIRFLSKVNKTKDCWMWRASTYVNGYGVIFDGKKLVSAHRFSFKHYNGKIPKGMCICHKCDNKLCVNPNHLFLGTQRDNMRDMYNKGRNRKIETYKSGSEHCNAKLTMKEATLIRKMYSKGNYSSRELASRFSISKPVILNIIHNRSYKNGK